MANFIYITLDTTAPSNPTILIDGGATFTTNFLVDLEISVGDGNTNGYQMLIWGDVDSSYNQNIQSSESQSSWIAYSTSPQVMLSQGDGAKSINIRVRDDVHNPSTVAIGNINLDTAIPTVIVSNPDVSKISKNEGKDTSTFTFQVEKDYVEYKVKVVGAIASGHDTGATIPTLNGSRNTSGTGSFNSSTVTTVTIKGTDLELASPSDGQKIIKVFVRDRNDFWSA